MIIGASESEFADQLRISRQGWTGASVMTENAATLLKDLGKIWKQMGSIFPFPFDVPRSHGEAAAERYEASMSEEFRE